MASIGSDLLLEEEKRLNQYFTDRTELRDKLKQAVIGSEPLHQKVWNITGEVGLGKSTVLRMLRMECSQRKAPVAYVLGRHQLTETKFLKELADRFAECGLNLKAFRSMYKKLALLGEDTKATEAVVEQAGKAGEKVAGALSGANPTANAAAKAASAAASARSGGSWLKKG